MGDTKMKSTEVKHILETRDFDAIGDDLIALRQSFDDYESVEDMVDDQGIENVVRFLCETFTNRYEF